MTLFPTAKPTGRWWHDHSLSIVLVALLAVQTAFALVDGAYVFNREQPFGPKVAAWSAPWWTWWRWHYNVSLVADSFGVLLIVVLSKWLRERDSDASS